jgi:hypothetical protein
MTPPRRAPYRPPPGAIRYPGNVAGILYEPRAYWHVEAVDTETDPTRVVFPRRNFLNGEAHPVTLTHLTLAPINYTFRTFADGAPVDAATYHNSMAGGFRCDILIAGPQRQSYARRTLRIPSWTARPRWEPQISSASPQASSLWNVTRWDFDHVMVIPELGDLEIQLSAITAPNGVNDPPEATPAFTIGVFEGPPPGVPGPGGLLMPGNTRIQPRTALAYANGAVQPPPFVPDGFGQAALVQGTPMLWPSTSQLSARTYNRQNTTQAGSTPVHGFAVQIDQIDYDDVVIDTNLIAALGAPAGQPVAPLSLRTAIRARMKNGGTGNYWWRPGAPLALVCPSITPAQVYKLPVPITLVPGDNLEIELETPGPVSIGGNEINPLYQVGVALCGFAAIEG